MSNQELASVRPRPGRLDPTNPGSAIFQFLQSLELVGTLQALTPADRTVILLGDFNSSPEDAAIGPIIPPYQIIAASFVDAWDKNPLRFLDPGGFTCCQLADLSNTMSLLNERIDIIFVRGPSFLPLAFVTAGFRSSRYMTHLIGYLTTAEYSRI